MFQKQIIFYDFGEFIQFSLHSFHKVGINYTFNLIFTNLVLLSLNICLRLSRNILHKFCLYIFYIYRIDVAFSDRLCLGLVSTDLISSIESNILDV